METTPESKLFGTLTWNDEIPEMPMLDGVFRRKSGKSIEISLVGDLDLDTDWKHFVRKSEDTWRLLLGCEAAILDQAAPEILKLHQKYFEDRWTGTPHALILELTLNLCCFYLDGKVHLWYSGSSVFSHRDVDLELDPELRINEVRFDG